MRLSVILALLATLCQYASCTTYYVASTGSDSNSGSAVGSPWATIDRVNLAINTLQSGDSVLFRRGDTFRGQINYAPSTPRPVTFGAYGDTALPRPVISGSVLVPSGQTWSNPSAGRYETTLPTVVNAPITNVFINGARQSLARWPNRNVQNMRLSFANVSSYDGTTLLSAGLTQPTGYWNGANLRIRTYNFGYSNGKVASYTQGGAAGGTLTLETEVGSAWTGGMGFYLDGVLNALDAPGEWFHNNATRRFYLYTPGQQPPSSFVVELSMYYAGLQIKNANGITVRDLHFDQQAQNGIGTSNNVNGLTISNCRFTNQEWWGVYLVGTANNVTVADNTFDTIFGGGIVHNKGDSVDILRNQLSNIGLWEGQGGADYFGIQLLKTNNSYVAYNTLRNIGFNGVNPVQCENVTIDSNVFVDVMLTVTDGGAFYQAGIGAGRLQTSIGTAFINNFVNGSMGGGFYATPSNSQNSNAVGIYADVGSHDLLVYNNTVMRVAADGIKTSARNSAFIGNWIEGGNQNLEWTGDPSKPTQIPNGNIAACNVLIKPVSYVMTSIVSGAGYGYSAGNFYCGPQEKPFRINGTRGHFNDMLLRLSNDTGSTFCLNPNATAVVPQNWGCDVRPHLVSRWRSAIAGAGHAIPTRFVPTLGLAIQATLRNVVINATVIPRPVVALRSMFATVAWSVAGGLTPLRKRQAAVALEVSLQMSTTGGEFGTVFTETASSFLRNVTGLVPGNAYSFRVCRTDDPIADVCGLSSPTATAEDPPGFTTSTSTSSSTTSTAASGSSSGSLSAGAATSTSSGSLGSVTPGATGSDAVANSQTDGTIPGLTQGGTAGISVMIAVVGAGIIAGAVVVVFFLLRRRNQRDLMTSSTQSVDLPVHAQQDPSSGEFICE